MTKLVRCEAGHVFDHKAHTACPECARLGIAHHGDRARGRGILPSAAAETATVEKTSGQTRRLAAAAGLALPFVWLAAGGAAAIAVTVGFVALRSPAGPPQPSPHQQQQSALQPVQPPQPATSVSPPPAPKPALPQAVSPPPAPQPPAPPPPPPENYALAQRLPGIYRIDGRNPNGSRYGGKVLITAGETGIYNLLWRISNGETYSGRGRLNGDTLTVDWGQQYPVIYRVGRDGMLRGWWDNGRGSENLAPD